MFVQVGMALQHLGQVFWRQKSQSCSNYTFSQSFITFFLPQVLQQSVDRELNMYSDLKERTNKVAQIMMLSLSSQPVDHEENGRFKLRSTEIGKPKKLRFISQLKILLYYFS